MYKKENSTSFEYFKRDEFIITGKHKDYVDQMWVQNTVQNSMFMRLVDLYPIAAIVGFLSERRSPADVSDEKRTVQLQQIVNNTQTLMPIMRVILMLDTSEGLSEEERMHRAFRIPDSKEEYEHNMELFNSYARGGIEVLYEELILKAGSVDDEYEDERLNKILALLQKQFTDDDLLS